MLLVLLVVLLALYVSVGRLFMANLNAYREPLLQELNARLPFSVSAQQINGVWRSFSPEIVLDELSVKVPGDASAPVQLAQGVISINLLQSLRTQTLALNHLTLEGLALRAELTPEGKLVIGGLDGSGDTDSEWLASFIRNIELISLRNNALALRLPSGEERVLGLDLQLVRNGIHRRLQGSLSSTAGTEILFLASGVGDPQRSETLTGSAYLEVKTPDMQAMRALMGPDAPPFWSRGAAEVAVWLTLQEGQPTIEARLDAQDLVVYSDDGKLELPLDSVKLQGHVQREKGSWTLSGSDMEVRQAETVLALPRVQVDVWGAAARVRLRDVPLAPVNQIATGIAIFPEALRDIFTTLSPTGMLPSVQINIGDISAPAQDWELDASFEQLAVQSFKGAPGVDAASGYARLKPGGGSVILDSQSLALAFPSIYHDPLAFDEVYGTLDIGWDKQAVMLSSGILTALGEEGTAKVMFGLDVPLEKTEAGVEMQLLVGLKNTDTQFRDKYIPYTLSAGLRNWLADSIDAGTIEEGAFLWRGSLRKEASARRTVQLAFNVTDAELNYHPQWPDVAIGAGQVLIDDAAVSVWSGAANLYDSQVKNMSVELRADKQGQLQLAIDAQLQGPARDGLRVVNESALSKTVGKTFSQWAATGELEADLSVLLNLSDKKAPPRVDVETRWSDVALKIVPGNLQIDDLVGDFSYSSARGFGSSSLVGKLWGKPVTAQLSHDHANNRVGYDPKTSALEIVAQSRVALASVQDWLSLDLLAMATGEADMKMSLVIKAGETPHMQVSSQLQGVAIDMPLPYGKSASEKRDLAVTLSLGQKELPLDVLLGDTLALELLLGQGALKAGSLGIFAAPLEQQPGQFLIAGQPPYIDGDAWLAFLNQYFALGGVLEPADPAQVDPSRAAASATPPSNIELSIAGLNTPLMTLWGREFEEVALALELSEGLWKLEASSDRLAGSAQFARPPGASRVSIERVDIDTLFESSVAGPKDDTSGPPAQPIEVPPLDIAINNIYRSGQRVGNLEFSLRSIGNVLKIGDVVGEFAGLEILADAPGQLLWRQGEEGNTRVDALVEFLDLGDSLEQFGYEKILKTKRGSLDAQLMWPGSPDQFALALAEGAILVDFDSGNFLEAPSGAAGALRVVNVLNLADIVRRLSLTHMFESGIAFDSVAGEIYLHGGSIEVARMAVKGPSSFQFSGVSSVAARSLNGELVATLPVANNLPWVAALAASLPVAAGVFVVSKVFDKQFSRLSSAVYTVDGTWDEPRVEFDRIFDDETKAVELPEAEGIEAAGDKGQGEQPGGDGVESNDTHVDIDAEPVSGETAG